MDAALALLSEEEEEEEHEDGEKKAEADEEEGEPASKRLRSETPRLDFSALQRAGYAANAETDAGNGGPEEAGGDEAIAERRNDRPRRHMSRLRKARWRYRAAPRPSELRRRVILYELLRVAAR
eukprot:TRINITY_DN18872_c0_g1_i2.p2 TRINITY_DN18872_c0_g1~~TRINITY_DN18872_c0_g1_i2.p2  ORF type:complete len:140 (-),score=30.27 TRINITY_DN18872_c0_g1_i2:345-716(-)